MIWLAAFAALAFALYEYVQMAKPNTIPGYAKAAGFTGADLAIAVAVALAESGGNPNAYNPETAAGTPQDMGSYGLWQIYLNAHPEFAGQNLLDPQTNANAAFSVYQAAGNSFKPWTTFKTGAYLSKMSNVDNSGLSADMSDATDEYDG
jgi:Lysozyme like domain